MTRTTCEVWGVAGDPRSGRPTSSQSRTDPPFRPPSSSAAAFKPCDDLPRYRTDFVTYCSATRYFHLPLHTASLQQALDAASQVESATLPRFNRDTRDTGCKRERMRDTVLVGDTFGRIKRDTVSPAYCPAATTLPCRSAREEKVTQCDPYFDLICTTWNIVEEDVLCWSFGKVSGCRAEVVFLAPPLL